MGELVEIREVLEGICVDREKVTLLFVVLRILVGGGLDSLSKEEELLFK